MKEFTLRSLCQTDFESTHSKRKQDLIQLVEMGAESKLNTQIITFLVVMFLQIGIPHYLLSNVVSPGEPEDSNYDRDYIEKRAGYAARDIGKYWIIDPDRRLVLVFTLKDRIYQERRFMGNDEIFSVTFPAFRMTVTEVLTAGR